MAANNSVPLSPYGSYSSDPGLEVVLSLIPTTLVTSAWAPFSLGPLRRLQDSRSEDDVTSEWAPATLALQEMQLLNDLDNTPQEESEWAPPALALGSARLSHSTSRGAAAPSELALPASAPGSMQRLQAVDEQETVMDTTTEWSAGYLESSRRRLSADGECRNAAAYAEASDRGKYRHRHVRR